MTEQDKKAASEQFAKLLRMRWPSGMETDDEGQQAMNIIANNIHNTLGGMGLTVNEGVFVLFATLYQLMESTEPDLYSTCVRGHWKQLDQIIQAACDAQTKPTHNSPQVMQ